jgi:TetR/AcrR family transcriptional regulator, cholesterol catabolism regulator
MDKAVNHRSNPTQDQPTRQSERRAEIVQIACDLFARDGYHKTSMSAVAEAAGMAKATIYHYFRSKEEILVSVQRGFEEFLTERRSSREETDAPVADELKALILDILELIYSNPSMVRVFFQHIDDPSGDYRDELVRSRKRLEDLIEDQISAGIRRGEIKHEFDPRLTTLAILGMCNWSYLWNQRQRYEPGYIADQFWALISKGFIPDNNSSGPAPTKRSPKS